MGLEPEGEGFALTIRQEGERPPPLQIDQHGPIGLALAIRPIVDTERVRRGNAWEGQTAQQVQQCVATDGQAQGTAQSHPCPAP
jgi:hypothetical protein